MRPLTLRKHDLKKLVVALSVTLGAAAAVPAQAALFTYTQDTTLLSGTIGGTGGTGGSSFTNATWTVTATADSSLVVPGTAGPFSLYSLTATPTFTLTDGSNTWTGTLTQTSGYDWNVLSIFSGGQGVVGFIAGTPAAGVSCTPGTNYSAASAYDLSTATSLSGSINGSTPCTLSTTIGDLVFASYSQSGISTFVAAPAGAAVPLPATLPLLIGGLGVLAVRRQRRTQRGE